MSEDKLKELGIFSPQEAVAKAVGELSSVEKVKILSNLNREKDVFRLALCFNASKGAGFQFLEDYANDSLMLRVSLKRKGKRGRDDIVDVVKQPSVPQGGITERIKSFVRGE